MWFLNVCLTLLLYRLYWVLPFIAVSEYGLLTFNWYLCAKDYLFGWTSSGLGLDFCFVLFPSRGCYIYPVLMLVLDWPLAPPLPLGLRSWPTIWYDWSKYWYFCCVLFSVVYSTCEMYLFLCLHNQFSKDSKTAILLGQHHLNKPYWENKVKTIIRYLVCSYVTCMNGE